MMHEFLARNRADLVARCVEKVAKRPTRNASQAQLDTGIPMFLDQLIQTLEAEEEDETRTGTRISGPSGGDQAALSEIGITATAHGKELFALDYTVDQVVHDYGDLCQAVTDLAFERDAPFTIDEYRTLNRCLENAIADAVTEFSAQRDDAIHIRHASEVNQRLGYLMHELRNALNSASLAADALRSGRMSADGATGAVLCRSHETMARLIERSLKEVKSKNAQMDRREVFSAAEFIGEAHQAGQLDANARGIKFVVWPVDPQLAVEGDRNLLLGALSNLIGNAMKFTRPNTAVALETRVVLGYILIEVSDQCGGLRLGDSERIFIPFSQRGDDKSGAGLGLSIAREAVRADGGTLTVRSLPCEGCVFTISLPIRPLGAA